MSPPSFGAIAARASACGPAVGFASSSILDGGAPALIEGLLQPANLDVEFILESDGDASVVLDRSPSQWVPTLGANATVYRPAQQLVSLRSAMQELRSKGRNHTAYVRHQSIDSLPALSTSLRASPVWDLVGPHVEMANLWLGDGSLGSGMHFDSVDNLLIQMRGEKRALLLPPRALTKLGYIPRQEWRHQMEAERFMTPEPTGNAPLDNFAALALGAVGSGEQQATIEDEPVLCTVRPGSALFIPALWSHAVVSSAQDGSAEGVGHDGSCDNADGAAASTIATAPPRNLNVAVNVWYVRGTHSVVAALSSGADGFAPAHNAHGTALQRLGRHAEAAAAHQRAIELRRPAPFFDAVRAKGLALLESGDAARAVRLLRKAVGMQPMVVHARCDLGDALRRAGRPHEALAALYDALSRQPTDARATASLGAALASTGRFAESAAHLAAAAALDPADAALHHHNRGVALEGGGLSSEAIAAFRAAVQLRPKWDAARNDLTTARERARRHRAIAANKDGWSWELERRLSGTDAAERPRRTARTPPSEPTPSSESTPPSESTPSSSPSLTVGSDGSEAAVDGREVMVDAQILRYTDSNPDASQLCLGYLNGNARAVERVLASDALAACGAEFRRLTGQTVAATMRPAPPRGSLRRQPQPWSEERCREDLAEGVRDACDFAARAWRVGHVQSGGWNAEFEHAAVLASPDAVVTAQAIHDARDLRFVRHNSTVLARGRASATHTPGMDTLPYHSYAAQQGLYQHQTYLGLPMAKMAWDLALLSMAIDELQPRSVIELGTASGASAMWVAEEARKRGVVHFGRVHTFDVKSAAALAAAYGFAEEREWLALLRNHSVDFHGGADLAREQDALPAALLGGIAHPWLIIDDAHVNTQRVARHLLRWMQPGDYLVCEDIRFGGAKRQGWFAFLDECGAGCALDLRYLDFFGVNRCCAPDGWMKKVQ